jgi:hypothetical protein
LSARVIPGRDKQSEQLHLQVNRRTGACTSGDESFGQGLRHFAASDESDLHFGGLTDSDVITGTA